MIQYLTKDAAIQQIKWGKAIEALLKYDNENEIRIIKYVTLASNRNGDKLILTIYECEDVGNENYIDLYSFPDAEPDYQPVRFEFEYIDDAFDKIIEIGGSIENLTSQFGLQEVYREILKSAQQGDAPERASPAR